METNSTTYYKIEGKSIEKVILDEPKLYNKAILRDMVYAGTDFKGWEKIIEQIIENQQKLEKKS